MKDKILWILFFSGSPWIFAQTDTTDRKKELILQEVTVKGTGSASEPTTDLQQQTDKVISGMSGITLIKRGNYAQEPTIRGLNAGQINTTIDGMHLFGACTDRMDPISSYVEPNNLSSIRLNLDPNEDQQGSHASSLDFKLMKATPGADRVWSGKAGVGFETNALARQSLASIQYSRSRLAFQVNGIYREAENYRAGNNVLIPFSYYQKWNVGAGFTGIITEHHRLVGSYLQDNGKDIGYPALTMDVAFANAKIGSLAHLYDNAGKKLFRWESKIYGNYIDHAMDDTKRPAELVPMHMDMPGTSRTMGFYSGGTLRLGKMNFLYLKVNGYQNDLHAEMTMYPENGNEMFMLTIPDARRSVLGFNASDKHYYKNGSQLSVGGRVELVRSEITTPLGRQTLTSMYSGDPDKIQWLYNAYARFERKIGKRSEIQFGTSYALRNPTLQEMYGFYLYNRVDAHDYLGNPDLKPESSVNCSVGGKISDDKWVVSGQLFAYFFSNYISGERLEDYSVMTIGGAGVKHYVNLSNAMIYGGELLFQWKITEKVLVESSNAVSIGSDDQHDPLPFIPPFRSTNKIQYDLKGYRFKLESVAALAQQRISTFKYGETATPGFVVLHAGVSKKYSFSGKILQAGFTIENIMDTPYYEHLDIMKIQRQGRNCIIHVTYVF